MKNSTIALVAAEYSLDHIMKFNENLTPVTCNDFDYENKILYSGDQMGNLTCRDMKEFFIESDKLSGQNFNTNKAMNILLNSCK